jgi:hypothetical protein
MAIPLVIAGPPALCGGGVDGVDLFAVGHDGQVLHTSFRESAWSGFEPLGIARARGGGVDPPVPPMVAACRSGRARLHAFVRGAAGDLLTNRRDGAGWSGWSSLGWPELPDPLYPVINVPAPLSGPPAACSGGPDRVDVFARGAAGDMLHRWWDGAGWSRYESLGMPVTGDLVALPFTGSTTPGSTGAGITTPRPEPPRERRWTRPVLTRTGQPGITARRRGQRCPLDVQDLVPRTHG